jgi:hypothetical protein
MNTKTKTPPDTSTDLLALCTILGGLLASGHFSTPENEETYCGLIRLDGFQDYERQIFSQDLEKAGYRKFNDFIPEVWPEAIELFEAAKDYCSAGKTKK